MLYTYRYTHTHTHMTGAKSPCQAHCRCDCFPAPDAPSPPPERLAQTPPDATVDACMPLPVPPLPCSTRYVSSEYVYASLPYCQDHQRICV